MAKGVFDLDDMAGQLEKLSGMGGLGGMLGMLPGARNIKAQLAGAQIDDKMVARQIAIIRSMTVAERRNVKLLNGSRKRRVATGSGTEVPEVNRLIKQFREMTKMMRKVAKQGKKGLMRGGMSGMPGMPGPGGLPPGMRR
jgi:signal recognition particle subunit SRP54